MSSHQALPPDECRAVVWARCMGRCELCGEPLDPTRWEAHHRLLRSQGGPWCPCNILALHADCHRDIHGHPAQAYADGHLVRMAGDPQQVAVWLPVPFVERPAQLSCGGTYH